VAFKKRGHIVAYLIVSRVDPTGAHLFSVHAHGSTDKLPYMTVGSGSLAAMGVLECDYRVGLEQEEAKDLVCRAVLGGVWNNLVLILLSLRMRRSNPFEWLMLMLQDTQVLRPFASMPSPTRRLKAYAHLPD